MFTVSADEPGPLELFEQRIMPIFKSPNPSSCLQCHLSAVDLKDYILPSSRDTFLALRDQELVDVKRPLDSKILQLINMGELDPDAVATRIHAKTRTAEYQAFSSWIVACCADRELVEHSPQTQLEIGPKRSLPVIRHNRKDRVLDSFERHIWSQRMRCFPCHTPAEIDATNPMHVEPAKRYREYIQQYGARMNLFAATPQQTLKQMLATSRKPNNGALPLINSQSPLNSLLLLKPTAKLPAKQADGTLAKPSSALPVSHAGGLKMHKDDHSYKAFAAWLSDYARSAQNGYESADDLPRDNWLPSEIVLRIIDTPEDWPLMSTVQLFVYAADEHNRDGQNSDPIAFTQGKVTPRRIVNGPLFLFERTGGLANSPDLPPGKYIVRAVLDSNGLLEQDPSRLLDRQTPVASVELEAQWKTGFKNAQIIDGRLIHAGSDK